MSNESLLAAVRAAANEPASRSDASTSQNQETTMADPKTGPADAPVITTLADLRGAYPALCTQLETETMVKGADAERARILGIENLGTQMKGHEKLVGEMKADASVTPEKAAMRIIEAENATRGQQLQGIKDIETHTGKVNASAPKPNDTITYAATPEGWKQEYEASDKLQAEYPTAEAYVATRRRESLKVVA